MRVPALAMLVLLLPIASACSWAEEPPTPATFTLVPNDGGNEVHLEVWGRMAGGDCSLSNPFAFDDGVFAWLEVQWNPSVHRVQLHDVATGERTEVTLSAQVAEGFGLWNGKLLYRSHEYQDEGRAPPISTFHVHDVVTGEVEELAFPDGNWPSVVYDGSRIVAIRRANGYEGPDSLYVYDVATREFLVEGRSLADLSERGTAHLMAAGEGWIAMSGDGPLLYEIETGETYPIRTNVRAIHDGYAWGWEGWGGSAGRTRIPDGPTEEFDTKGPVVGFVPGYRVLGQFSPARSPEAVPVPPVEAFEGTGPSFSMLARIALFLLGPLGLLGLLFGML